MNKIEKMELPLISIIVLAYNVERYISECLSAIVNQTYSNIEIIIVVNGKSNDSTEAIVSEFSQKDDRIKLVYNHKNSIIGEGRLLGLNAVSGNYFTFVDGDDYLESSGIKDLVSTAIHSPDGDVIIGSYQQVDETGKFLSIAGMPEYQELLPKEYLPLCFLYVDTLIHGKLYSAKLLQETSIQFVLNNSLGEDKMIHLQLVSNASKIVRCLPVVHNFRKNSKSITNNLQYKNFRDEFINFGKIGTQVFQPQEYFMEKTFVTAFKSHHLILLYHCFFTGGVKIFTDAKEMTSELLYGGYLKKKNIRAYLNQWKLYIPILELYRINKYIGGLMCWLLNTGRILMRMIRNRIITNYFK
jgi:Glycosyltransferases involved in cell wall biogenesis